MFYLHNSSQKIFKLVSVKIVIRMFFSYTILVVEQEVGEAFNRAKLFNVGYQELKVLYLLYFYSSLYITGWFFKIVFAYNELLIFFLNVQ